jgi:preprotein translocase subunit SecD
MNFYARRFNVYLILMLMLATAGTGCALFHKKKAEPVGAVRVHIESPDSVESDSQTVSVLRADPVMVTIAKEAILTEASLLKATLVTSPGGFYVELQFDSTGALTLEQFSAAYGGKHFVIFGQWGVKLKDGRWLAAPIIQGRNANGRLAFTPDMTREEAQQWVDGLNHTAKKLQTGK